MKTVVVPHGTVNGYNNYRCSCDACRRAKADAQRAGNAGRKQRLPEMFDQLQHGLKSTYVNWGCRCEPCSEANRLTCREHYAKRKAAR